MQKIILPIIMCLHTGALGNQTWNHDEQNLSQIFNEVKSSRHSNQRHLLSDSVPLPILQLWNQQGQKDYIGEHSIRGSSPHTLAIRFKAGQQYGQPTRMWVAVLGQMYSYSEHWILGTYLLGDYGLQFGSWGSPGWIMTQILNTDPSLTKITAKMLLSEQRTRTWTTVYHQDKTYSLFIDGEIVAIKVEVPFYISTGDLFVGTSACFNEGNRCFDGLVYGVKLWNVSLEPIAVFMAHVQWVDSDCSKGTNWTEESGLSTCCQCSAGNYTESGKVKGLE